MPTITRQQIDARLVELRKGLAEASASFDRINGAILDCEHWLTVVDKPAPLAPVPSVTEPKQVGE